MNMKCGQTVCLQLCQLCFAVVPHTDVLERLAAKPLQEELDIIDIEPTAVGLDPSRCHHFLPWLRMVTVHSLESRDEFLVHVPLPGAKDKEGHILPQMAVVDCLWGEPK
jgi:hypothetical protein